MGWLSLHCLVPFLEFWSVLSFGSYLFVSVHLLCCQGRSPGICQGQATHIIALWCCMWGRGQRGQCNLLSSCPTFSHLPTTHPETNWALLMLIPPDGWAWVHCRIQCLSPVDLLMSLGVSPTATSPTGFYSHRFWGFSFPGWNPGLYSQSCSPVVPPDLSTHECGISSSPTCCLTLPGPPATSLSYDCILATPVSRLCPSYQSGWMFL